MVKCLLIALSLLIAVAASASAETLSASDFTAELNKAFKANEQYKTSTLYWLLERDNPSAEQRKRADLIYADMKGSPGDDLTGSVEAYFIYLAKYPDGVDDAFYREFEYRFGQYSATAKRVHTATAATDAVIRDLWSLGYWIDALAILQTSGVQPNSVLIQDMQRTGYLCPEAEAATEARYRYTINNKEHVLGICAATHTPIFPSPQPYQADNIQPHIEKTLRLHAEQMAEAKTARYAAKN
ncbi:MAG: hypothetical protein AAGF20_04005 [Pseudomonadota bacterium]